MIKKIVLSLMLWITLIVNQFAYADNYDGLLDEVSKDRTWEIKKNNIKDFMISIWKDVLAPIVIIIWLLIAFIWFYSLMFSEKEDERKKWQNFFIWWTIWVVLIVSARFLVDTLFWDSWTSWILWIWSWDYNPIDIAEKLYRDIISKFFYMAMYLVIWILFIILVINLIKLISSPDKEDIKKNSKTIIVWNTIWIIIVLSAKNIIKTFYSKMAWSTSLWDQNPILESKSLPWLYTILNYFLWFVAFAITIFIIYQAFQLLLKPNDEATYKNLKKYFVYSLVWILIIWWVYLIANFFIIKAR